MTITEEITHTAACAEIIGDESDPYNRIPTMQALTPAQRETVLTCPHPNHDVTKQFWRRG